MTKPDTTDTVAEFFQALIPQITRAQSLTAELRNSSQDYLQALSLDYLGKSLEACTLILAEVEKAKASSEQDLLQARFTDLLGEVRDNLLSSALRLDLDAVEEEAKEARKAAAKSRKAPHSANLSRIDALKRVLADIETQAAAGDDILGVLASRTSKERPMPDTPQLDELANAVASIGVQLARNNTAPAAGGSSGAGDYREVPTQMNATLQAVGAPQYGVAFARDDRRSHAALDMIDALSDSFEAVEADGKTSYRLSQAPTSRRSVSRNSPLLAGAARVEAHVIETESQHLLAALDGLQTILRFRVQPGVPTAETYRARIAERLEELVAVMEDPFGVNRARANMLLAWVGLDIARYLDLSELQPNGQGSELWYGLFALVVDADTINDPDELSIERSVIDDSRYRAGIQRLAYVFRTLAMRLRDFAADDAGTYAARLEETLHVLNGSAHDLRDILASTGTSASERNVMLFATRPVSIQKIRATRYRPTRPASMISVAQLIDWVITLTDPHVGPEHQAASLSAREVKLVTGELALQCHMLSALMAQADEFDFAFKLSPVYVQTREFQSQLENALQWASALADTAG
ncbi:hypothetical protein [Maricaulis sp.]|uniref:hypothetical protein n=1 Tax=Maricaulis sp. TaxID=1486257 RepID=UPI00260D9EF2|nr:hypothetical protein [Maricaulis sp.]